MRILVGLLAWLLEQTVHPNRAGRLVPVPDDGMEPGFARTLIAHWLLWMAVVLALLALAAGYARRRWRARERPGTARLALLWARRRK
jgi:hypothetical protein